MGIFQTDALLKTLLEQTIQDIKQNLWLLDYILDDFVTNPFLKSKYGQKQIESAKEWFADGRNNINVQLQFSKDKEKFPAVFLTLGSSAEDQELRTMGDVGTENLTLMPNQVGQPIPYVIPPFIPTSFDPVSGLVGVPIGTDLSPVSQGMVLINPSNGNGVVIQGVQNGEIQVQAGVELDSSQFGVIPQYRFFTSRLGRSFFNENWNITLVTNDPQTLLWMHSITVYGLLRYREFLEHNGFLQTYFSSTDIFTSEFSNAEGEEFFARQITMFGKVEQKFIRGLHRNIESVLLRDQNPEAVTLENPKGYTGGVKIISNETTPPLHQNDTNWFTVEGSEENEDDSDQ
jgi:hypothetical protein